MKNLILIILVLVVVVAYVFLSKSKGESVVRNKIKQLLTPEQQKGLNGWMLLIKNEPDQEKWGTKKQAQELGISVDDSLALSAFYQYYTSGADGITEAMWHELWQAANSKITGLF